MLDVDLLAVVVLKIRPRKKYQSICEAVDEESKSLLSAIAFDQLVDSSYLKNLYEFKVIYVIGKLRNVA